MPEIQYMEPLTAEEKAFAEDHHSLVIYYLVSRKLPFDTYYDLIIFRYLRSVKRWFSEEKLRRYQFTTIACEAMRSAVSSHARSLDRQSKYGTILSLDIALGDPDGGPLYEEVPDPYNAYEQIENREIILEELRKLDFARRKEIYEEHFA